MILDALIQQFKQRFDFEKRARVCLWFDERREFVSLLPAFARHVESTAPSVRLLVYDEALCHGQIWMRRQIALALDAASEEEAKALRFVLYLPFPEDAVGGPPGKGTTLELLTEALYAGVVWRMGGRRPTLFTFLRQAGVPLPDDAVEQRRLYEGGAGSLLSKYAARFADRSSAFWTSPLTAELARQRLVDVDQTILDLAVDPEGTMRALADRGTAAEFQTLVEERYGYSATLSYPGEWLDGLVALIALTETFLGFGESVDFPFRERLPPAVLRPHHQQLLQRWLRDAEARPAWDRLIAAVETRIDLSPWAEGRTGAAFAFPHLVRLRWHAIERELDAAAGKRTTLTELFAKHGNLILKEAEFARASAAPMKGWDLLIALRRFVGACEGGLREVEAATNAAALVTVYVKNAAAIDGEHLRIRFEADSQNLPSAARVADRYYGEYVTALNSKVFPLWSRDGMASLSGAPDVTGELAQAFWHAEGKRALIIIDALRYDCAVAIEKELSGSSAEVSPMIAMLPTITPVGMTALMPIGAARVRMNTKGNSVHPMIAGRDMSARENRLAFMSELGADCRDIGSIESASKAPPDLGEMLVVFGHDDVDHIGHGDAQALVRHLRIEIERVVRLIRKLHRWDYPVVHVVTDHGFIIVDEEKLPPEVKCDKDWCLVRKERFAIVAASADLPLTTFEAPWDATIRVAVPPATAFFKAEKSFSHGGATLQELVIPHLVSRTRQRQRRMEIEVVVPLRTLSRAAVRVTLRPKAEGQLDLFSTTTRTLSIDVVREAGQSVVAGGAKTLPIVPNAGEKALTLFFGTTEQFRRGETLDLRVRDVDTEERIPPGGIKLTVDFDS